MSQKLNYYSFLVPAGCALVSAFSAFKMKDASFALRFGMGMAIEELTFRVVEKYAFADIRSILLGDADPTMTFPWILFNNLWLSIVGKSIIGFFGSNHYYKRHNIDSIQKAVLSPFLPGQEYWRVKGDPNEKQNIKNGYVNLLKSFGKTCLGFAAMGTMIGVINRYELLDYILSKPILHMAVLGLCATLPSGVYNVPTVLVGLFVNHKVELRDRYDVLCFISSSCRDFWKRFTRVGGEMYKYQIYIPLGGNKRPVLATLGLFTFNCWTHHRTSLRMYGSEWIDVRKMKSGWNKGFATMGIAVALQLVVETKVSDEQKESMPWRVSMFGLFASSMLLTLSFIHENSMVFSLSKSVKQ
eukprot:109207_1